MQTPTTYYQQQVTQGIILPDEQQLTLLSQLEKISTALITESKARSRFYNRFRRKKTIQGSYIWGGVGIGKTFIMDCFYHALPIENKRRTHFHQFMREIHAHMTEQQGKENPLHIVAKQLANNAMVICLDELIVSDIADAMILRRLFQALIAEGVTLVITSNTKPDNLYLKGLQRISFLPAIDLIKKNLQIMHATSTIDYRLKHLLQAGVYHVPHDDIALDDMEKCFELLTCGEKSHHQPIPVCDRLIPIVKAVKECVWFDFAVLCSPPRSQHDYLALAKTYKSIFISNIPLISADKNDIILLFIRLIDVLYDARVRVVMSAAAMPAELYTKGEMLADYQRTQSRLIEMQSEDYFSRPH